MKPRVSFAAIVLLIASVAGFYNMRMRQEWTADGYVYALRAEVDAGVPYARALASARDAYRAKPAMESKRSRASMNAPAPEWWTLFAPRVLYPALASLTWRFTGFQSLVYLSFAAYVAAAALLYAIFLRFSAPAVAAAVTIFCMLNTEAQLIGRSNLTDMTAFALLAAALLAAMRYAERGRFVDLSAFAIAAGLLSCTRPATYELVCAAAPLLFANVWRRGIDLLSISLLFSMAVAIAMRLSGAELPAVTNGVAAVFATSGIAIVALLAHAAAPISLIALYALRQRSDVMICGGALASMAATILLNPTPTDVMRIVILPSLIPLGCGFAIAAQAALDAGRAYRADASIVGEWSGSESILAAQRPKSSPSV